MLLPPHFPRSAPSLFPLMTARPGTIHRILYIALREWSYFGGNYESLSGVVVRSHDQSEPGYYKRVGDYWKKGAGVNHDGKDTDPWSAAFVSFVMYSAGVSLHDFLRAQSHSRYIHFALQNRVKNTVGAKFIGRRLTEYRPKEGDLICNTREKSHMTYDKAIKQDGYESHCDIVVFVRPGEMGVIGGNVSGTSKGHRTVGLRTRKLTSGGYLVNRTSDPFFAILENRLPLN